MSEFKVGDRVRIIENDVEGLVEQVMVLELRDYSNLNEGDFDCRYRVVNKNKFYDNLTDNDLELIEASKQLTLEQLEQRIEKLEKEVFKPIVIHDGPKEKSLLTEDERVILRNLEKDLQWIVRDESGDLTVHVDYPYMNNRYHWVSDGDSIFFDLFNHIFKNIKWGDKPYNIEELLKGESGNE